VGSVGGTADMQYRHEEMPTISSLPPLISSNNIPAGAPPQPPRRGNSRTLTEPPLLPPSLAGTRSGETSPLDRRVNIQLPLPGSPFGSRSAAGETPLAPFGSMVRAGSPLVQHPTVPQEQADLPSVPRELAPALPQMNNDSASRFDTSLGRDTSSPSLAVVPEPGDASPGQSQMQLELLRRVRRMYIEKVIRNSERLAYDERVDMRSSAGSQVAFLVLALAHAAVACFWTMSLFLMIIHVVHLSGTSAWRWFYACISSWVFSWFILDVVRSILLTILELQQYSQRRRLKDHRSLRNQVAAKKALKMRQMASVMRRGDAVRPEDADRDPAGVDAGGIRELLPAVDTPGGPPDPVF